jgi:hypothetical protein
VDPKADKFEKNIGENVKVCVSLISKILEN